MKVIIVGGGASGLMAALTASERPDARVVLLERQARVGRKLLATGNGRCNLSNRNLTPKNYHGENAGFCEYALSRFGPEQTLAWFRALGLLTAAEESGRVYPVSDSANSVVDVLRLALAQRENVELRAGCEVQALRKKRGKFEVVLPEETLTGEAVIVCAGGCAGGKLGGTELGYRLLEGMGHHCTRLCPALVQLRTDTTYVRALKGVRCDVRATYRASGTAEERCGEVQFTEYGVSGPAIFELSRAVSVHPVPGTLLLDLLPEVSEEEVLALLEARCAGTPGWKAEELLTGFVHNRLGKTLLRSCGISFETDCSSLSADTLRAVCRAVKHFAIEVKGTMGMDGAQVTAGGILTSEFRADTMESRLCRGLYAAGEVLDIDGDCGGYNLQWAWSSGRLAGELRGME